MFGILQLIINLNSCSLEQSTWCQVQDQVHGRHADHREPAVWIPGAESARLTVNG